MRYIPVQGPGGDIIPAPRPGRIYHTRMIQGSGEYTILTWDLYRAQVRYSILVQDPGGIHYTRTGPRRDNMYPYRARVGYTIPVQGPDGI